MSDILDDLKDLRKQATTHRVASCCKRAIAEIERLRAALSVLVEGRLK